MLDSGDKDATLIANHTSTPRYHDDGTTTSHVRGILGKYFDSVEKPKGINPGSNVFVCKGKKKI